MKMLARVGWNATAVALVDSGKVSSMECKLARPSRSIRGRLRRHEFGSATEGLVFVKTLGKLLIPMPKGGGKAADVLDTSDETCAQFGVKMRDILRTPLG